MRTPRYARLEGRVAVDPLDAEAWELLIAEVASGGPEDFRPVFDRCTQFFPNAAVV